MSEIGDQADLEPLLLSHVTLITSDALTSQVIDTLPAASLPDIQISGSVRLFNGLRRAFGAAAPPLTADEQRSLLVDHVKSDLTVRRVRDTAVLEVIYGAQTPQRAADLANAFAQAMLARLQGQSDQRAAQDVAFSRARIDDLREQIGNLMTQTQNLRRGMADGRGGVQDLEARILQLTLSLSELDQTHTDLLQQVARLNRGDDPDALRLAAMQTERGANLFLAYEQTLTGTPSAPGNQRGGASSSLLRDLELLRQQKLVELQQALSSVIARRDRISGDLQDAIALRNSPEWSQIRIAEYETGILETLYADHLKALETAQEQALAAPVRLLSEARPDPHPAWPRYQLLLLLALIGAVGVGAVIAVWREWGRVAHDRLPQGAGSQFQVLRERWALLEDQDGAPRDRP